MLLELKIFAANVGKPDLKNEAQASCANSFFLLSQRVVVKRSLKGEGASPDLMTCVK